MQTSCFSYKLVNEKIIRTSVIEVVLQSFSTLQRNATNVAVMGKGMPCCVRPFYQCPNFVIATVLYNKSMNAHMYTFFIKNNNKVSTHQ
ncbi:hypothetical protein ACH3XW_21305 [Acanthocheilonema viteae]